MRPSEAEFRAAQKGGRVYRWGRTATAHLHMFNSRAGDVNQLKPATEHPYIGINTSQQYIRHGCRLPRRCTICCKSADKPDHGRWNNVDRRQIVRRNFREFRQDGKFVDETGGVCPHLRGEAAPGVESGRAILRLMAGRKRRNSLT